MSANDTLFLQTSKVTSCLEAIKNLWYAGGQLEALAELNREFASFPEKCPSVLDPEVFADLVLTRAGLELNLDRYRPSYQLLAMAKEAAEGSRDPMLRLRFHNNCAVALRGLGCYEESITHLESALTATCAGDLSQRLRPLFEFNLATVAQALGLFKNADALLQNCLQAFHESGNRWRVAMVFRQLGSLANDQGNFIEARGFLEHSQSLNNELNDQVSISKTHIELARNAANHGDLASAQAHVQQALRALSGTPSNPILTRLHLMQLLYQVEGLSATTANAQIQSLTQSLHLAREFGDVQTELLSLEALCPLLECFGDQGAALTAIKDYQSLERRCLAGKHYRRFLEFEKWCSLKFSQQEPRDHQTQNDDLQKANVELREVIEDNDAFLSILAHDLKNPLGAIFSASNMLKIERYPEMDRDVIRWIHAESRRLFHFVEDLLRISRFFNKWSPHPDILPLTDVVLRSSHRATEDAVHRSITLIQPATFHDTVVISDSEAVGEVLCNLFLYAVNRTPEFGTVICRIEEGGNEARIKLMLESVVLEPSEQEKLFSAYQRKEETGLRPEEIVMRMGMHLCSRISQTIGATLTWHQEPQRGTLLVSIPSAWPESSNR